jgi:hypothetical protein
MMPISFTMLTENMPMKQRSRVLTLIGLNYTFGEMLVCVFGLIFLDNLETGNCNKLIIFNFLTLFKAILFSVK